MTYGISRIWRILSLLICSVVIALPQSKDLDIDLANRNFRVLLGQRLNSFLKPQYVKKTRLAFVNNRLGFDLKFILGDEFETHRKKDGILTIPFVGNNKTIFVVVYEKGINKLTAALDMGHIEHAEMIRSIDFCLLVNELLFEITSETQRNEILKTLAQTSKMPDDEVKQKTIRSMLAKHFPAPKVVRFFLSLRLRYADVYPNAGLFESVNYIFGKDVKEELSKFLLDNL